MHQSLPPGPTTATTSLILIAASHPVSASVEKGSGAIVLGHPSTTVLGVTETEFYMSDCDVERPTSNGIDGLIVKLTAANYFSAEGFEPGNVRIPLSVAFCTADCRWIYTVPSEDKMVEDFTVPKSSVQFDAGL